MRIYLQRLASPQCLCPLIAALCTSGYLFVWWNRYLGLSLDGYLPLYGSLILEGKIPYRDFFLHLPPLNPLIDAGLNFLFEDTLIVYRIAGVCERIGMSALLAYWLSKYFRPVTSIATTLIAVWMSSCCDTEILDLYNHHSLFFALCSGLLAVRALDGQKRAWTGAGSGFFAGLAFFTKQTSGLGASLAVPATWIVLAFVFRHDARALLMRVFQFVAGWLAVAAPVCVWLYGHDAFSAFIQQVFLDASKSKGAAIHLILRPWIDPFKFRLLAWPAGVAIGLTLLAALTLRPRLVSGEKRMSIRHLIPVVVLPLLYVELLDMVKADPNATLLRYVLALSLVGVFLSTYGLWFVLVNSGRLICTSSTDDRWPGLFLLTILSIFLNATFALSFPGDTICATPGLALVTALAFDGVARTRWGSSARWIIFGAATCATLSAITVQHFRPFEFAHWKEPAVSHALAQSTLDKLEGIRLSNGTRNAVDEICAQILAKTKEQDTLFTFPVYPIFNWLTGRPLPTFAILHWFDVTPDHIVDEDMERIKRSPPAAVVIQRLNETEIALHETYFRAGKESAVRRMQIDMASMLQEDYTKVGSWNGAETYAPLELWIRKDRLSRQTNAEAGDSKPIKGVSGR